MTPRNNSFRENAVSSLNKTTWTLSLELHMSVDLAHDLNPFYAIGLFLTPLKHHVVFLCFQRVLKKTGDVIWAK